ncbi:predicted protein [Uncinocarpus reesii 1704]|uniref:Uncharacterized protein n=1 Tax=Uncinocarpus reesii (strain UAMH 1704) TaxID=336963 RepID=C4JV39_UNCRE|nr:uncharacterized protein UREG_06431 [Uncinocarpus reesii 1704]EEP81566.1 predicted protein [Uncinocarpus reesii 1704]
MWPPMLHTLGYAAWGCFLVGTAISVWKTLSQLPGRDAEPNCLIHGDPDMYGLGVRLGLYMQLLTTTTIDVFAKPEDAADLAPTNLWYLLAVFLAIQSRGFLLPGANPVNTFIIISLGNGITLTVLTGTLRLNPKGIKESCLAATSRFIIWALWKTSSVRFWWIALNHGHSSNCPEFGWFFSPVHLHGWFKVFHQALNTAEWVLWLVFFFPYLVGLFFITITIAKLRNPPANRSRILWSLFFTPVEEVHRIIFGNVKVRCFLRIHLLITVTNKVAHPGQNKPRPRRPSRGTTICLETDTSILVVTVLTTELSVQINGVQAVNKVDSSGQLIAFTVGVGSFVNAVLKIWSPRKHFRP